MICAALLVSALHLGSAVQYETRRFAPVVGSWLRHTRSQGGYRGQPPPPPLPPPQQPPPALAQDQEPGYGAEEEQQEELDLHGDKEFCVDVSSYEAVVWEEREAELCSTQWRMVCEDREQQLCEDVAETRCDVQPYTDCQLTSEPLEFQETELVAKEFQEKECEQGRKEIPHQKLLPECRNVTKQNCVTLWETDEAGAQQWAGTDSCEPVTWQECDLVAKEVTFIVPEISCRDKAEGVWYHEPGPVTRTKEATRFTCTARSSVSCVTEVRPVCKVARWQDCAEVPVPSCRPKSVHVPTQEYLHRKKCLLPDEQTGGGQAQASGGSYSGNGLAGQPLPTYGG